jgi:hypothetical protein
MTPSGLDDGSRQARRAERQRRRVQAEAQQRFPVAPRQAWGEDRRGSWSSTASTASSEELRSENWYRGEAGRMNYAQFEAAAWYLDNKGK